MNCVNSIPSLNGGTCEHKTLLPPAQPQQPQTPQTPSGAQTPHMAHPDAHEKGENLRSIIERDILPI